MARPLAGLTLLEAAAVPGETLAADAVANALAGVFRASAAAGRIAVAMSGGVDSAVALLRAGSNAVGVTLRLWLDPTGPDAERVCCSPAAVIRARETCHALGAAARHARPARGVPRRRRPAVRRRLRGRSDAEPVHALQRRLPLRGARRLRRAGRRRVLWTGHYARLVERDGLRLVARAADREKDQSYMLATVAPALLEHVGFPLGSRRRPRCAPRRPRPASLPRGAGRARRRASSPAGTTARSSSVTASSGHRARSSTRTATVVGRHDGIWRFTPGQRRGTRRRVDRAALRASLRPAHQHARRRAAERARRSGRVVARGRMRRPGATEPRSSSVTAPLRWRPTSSATRDGFALELDEPVEAVAPGQVAALYDDGAVVGAGVIERATG